MCGIIFVKSKSAETTRALAALQFSNQISRGEAGFGVVEVDRRVVTRHLKTDQFLAGIKDTKSKALMLHHRIPTSTDNRLSATHPFIVRSADGTLELELIHNGVIRNQDHILSRLGVNKTDLTSYQHGKYNDSEALALDVVDAISTGRKKLYAAGTMAIMALDRKANKLYLARNTGNPIQFYDGDGYYVISSENEGGAYLEPDKLFSVDLTTDKFFEEGEFRADLYDQSYFPKASSVSPARVPVEGVHAHSSVVESNYGKMLLPVLFKADIIEGQEKPTKERGKSIIKISGFFVPCLHAKGQQCREKDCIFSSLQKSRLFDPGMNAYFKKSSIHCPSCHGITSEHTKTIGCINYYRNLWLENGPDAVKRSLSTSLQLTLPQHEPDPERVPLNLSIDFDTIKDTLRDELKRKDKLRVEEILGQEEYEELLGRIELLEEGIDYLESLGLKSEAEVNFYNFMKHRKENLMDIEQNVCHLFYEEIGYATR